MTAKVGTGGPRVRLLRGRIRRRNSFPAAEKIATRRAELGPARRDIFCHVCCTPRGLNHLCTASIAAAVFDSVQFRQSNYQWHAHLVLLMPDHLHALIAFPPDKAMLSTIRLWKTFLARQHGVSWQRDFFEHRIRDDHAFEEKAVYIRQNPVRAGLVSQPAEWKYVWQPSRR